MHIVPNAHQQADLFIKDNTHQKLEKLMKVMDNINEKNGNHTIFIAAEGTNPWWKMRSSFRSSRYTTNWHELAQVKIKSCESILKANGF